MNLTVDRPSSCCCKKSVDGKELDEEVAMLEKRVTGLEQQLADRTNALLVMFLVLTGLFLNLIHLPTLAILVGFLGVTGFILYLIHLFRSIESKQVE